MFKKMSKHISMLASAFVLCCGFINTAQALPYNQISQVYFFGDSLTDSGANDTWPGLPVGKAPTFTTFGGYTWAQYVARDIKGFVLPVYPGPNPPDTITNNSIYPFSPYDSGTLRGIDYAAAGSTTNAAGYNETWAPSLIQQVNYYLSSNNQTADPNAVYFIWSGANDIISVLTAGTIPTQLQLLTAANTAATNIYNAAAALSSRGAKRIVVLALPNLGYTPLVSQIAATYNIPTLPATMQTLTFSFNSMLNTQLGLLIAKYGTNVLYIDVYNILNNVILATQAGVPYVVAGQSFQFANYTDPACATVTSAIDCPSTAPSNYVFADVLHPTDMAHRALSLQVESQIQNWA